jgi:transcriptional regulator with XRE-family HTH domain
MKEIIQRLKELRKKLGINQGKFAERIGLKQGSYSDIENEKEVLTQRNIKLICLEFGVNTTWLITGKGLMFLQKSDAQVIERLDGTGLTSDERELLEIYDRLLPETQDEVRDYASEKLELQELRGESPEKTDAEKGADALQNTILKENENE